MLCMVGFKLVMLRVHIRYGRGSCYVWLGFKLVMMVAHVRHGRGSVRVMFGWGSS